MVKMDWEISMASVQRHERLPELGLELGLELDTETLSLHLGTQTPETCLPMSNWERTTSWPSSESQDHRCPIAPSKV
jgi:hypothetical protein